MSDSLYRAFFRVHDGLPRQAPGSDDMTREALRRLGPFPEGARVLDLGCGPGAHSLVLAEALRAQVTAVDRHGPYLAALERRAAERGLAHLIRPVQADFAALEEQPGSCDLLWCEGAIYLLGFAAGLEAWRPLLRPGGRMAVTELTWISEAPSPEARAFWSEAYPAMGTIASNTAAAEGAGFEVLETIVLPQHAWWDDYYGPLRRRVDALRAEAEADPDLAAAIREADREIGLYERDPHSYSYVFYLLRSRPR
ncbi:methyltransferase type 11 [Sorangium cellulosum]|uniref:Methyltransferase type 11 n=1 Tax=Sorangium cellulosum TaxID=56 RepID=A0A2L0ETB4_SORCE|nr:class I SAM-dependent methyltransferase [Sorangium cellulosum]AUX42533.1 methyltransferase type 11 [Sorangium cellulosum]